MNRYEQVTQSAGLSEEDARRLALARPLLEHHFHEVARDFYAWIEQSPEARAVFADEAQLKRQEASLVGWLHRLFSGPHDESFAGATSRIGRVHQAVSVPQHLMLIGMSVIRVGLEKLVRRHPVPDADAVIRAIGRILDVQLVFMLDAYFEAMLARARDAEQLAAKRREQRLASIALLAAGLAHHTRNPLHGAALHLTLLERAIARGKATSAELSEAIGVIKSELARVGDVCDAFVDFARPEPLEIERVDLRDVCNGATSSVTKAANDNGVELRVELPEQRVIAWADRTKLMRVVTTLLQNSIDALERAPHGAGVVTVRTNRHGLSSIIAVEDNGPGISDASVPVFDPFFTTKAAAEGLGLTVAHRIVTDHDGEISFVSRPGRTVFTVTLPAKASVES
jgi:signal transduction histidine kinase